MDNQENPKTQVNQLFANFFLISNCRKTFADLLNEGLAIKLDPNAKVSPEELMVYVQTKGSNISPNGILRVSESENLIERAREVLETIRISE